MKPTPDRWEHGSEFHWPPLPEAAVSEVMPWEAGALFGSGRDALRAVIEFGRRARGWRRFWVPSFFCQEVVASLASTGLPLAVYPDGPLVSSLIPPPLCAGDAFLHVNYFGLREGPSLALPDRVDLVEDHTHDPASPWAASSTASFCIASLRKTLPIPDGGVAWSPRGIALPSAAPVSVERARGSANKLAAMLLKRLYFLGHPIEKEEFRRLAAEGEAAIATGPVSGMPAPTFALLRGLPIRAWRAARGENHARMARLLERAPSMRVLRPVSPECVPSCVYLIFETAERKERVRNSLIQQKIYPSVLWSLDETVLPVTEEDRALSRRVLSVHCDSRYSAEESERVAALIVRESAD